MIETLLAVLAAWVITVIETTGYVGVFLLMAAESANIPIPSEVIMPFSGFVAFGGTFSFWVVVVVGALGNLFGSLVSYFFAGWIVRHRDKLFLRFLISDDILALSERWFSRYGEATAFFSRLLPIVRTFISLPAGLGKMPLVKFSLYTFAGSLLWSALLAWIGWVLGANWHNLSQYFRQFDYLILVLLVVGVVWWGWKHVRGMMKNKQQ